MSQPPTSATPPDVQTDDDVEEVLDPSAFEQDVFLLNAYLMNLD